MALEPTPAVVRALQAAHLLARASGSEVVETGHLLRGLLQEEEGRAASLLREAGLDVSAYHPPAVLTEDESPPLPLQPAARSILSEARGLAHELFGESELASEALLLALLRGDTSLRAVLEQHGLHFERLEEVLLAGLGPPLALDEPLRLADPDEEIDVARILDACGNRAREGLRVLEDYVRFVLDDTFLSGALKQLRHDLTAALARLAPELLLASRETQHDVGTTLRTTAEEERSSLREVVTANLKRLQEALRSLEEYGKILDAGLGRDLEQIRYRAYTLERALVLGSSARQRLQGALLQVLVSGTRGLDALHTTIAEAAAGGAHIIQLRAKDVTDRELLERARQARRSTRAAHVLFIVNDRPDIARLVEADGVHLGQDDLPVREARKLLGPEALIGVSTHNLRQVRQAILDGASYLGVGPTFPSSTKTFAEFPGTDFVRLALAETSLPAFVIGGITTATIAEAVAAGARRVAVGAAVADADDPRGTTEALVNVLLKANRNR